MNNKEPNSAAQKPDIQETKSFELPQNKNHWKYIAFFLLFIIIGLSGFLFYLYFNGRMSNISLIKSLRLVPSPTPVDEIRLKKEALGNFYQQLRKAENDKDYEKLYEILKLTLGTWVTKEEFVTNEKNKDIKKPILSSETIVHDIKVDNDLGVVDRTIINCYSEECSGTDRVENHTTRKYFYINGEWISPPDKEPSERAMKITSYILVNTSDAVKNKFLDLYSYGTNRNDVTIHFHALYLDENPEILTYDETLMEKEKVNASRPIVNYQPPDINVQAPVQPQPVYNNSLNCTSNKIGNYTYTNCY